MDNKQGEPKMLIQEGEFDITGVSDTLSTKAHYQTLEEHTVFKRKGKGNTNGEDG